MQCNGYPVIMRRGAQCRASDTSSQAVLAVVRTSLSVAVRAVGLPCVPFEAEYISMRERLFLPFVKSYGSRKRINIHRRLWLCGWNIHVFVNIYHGRVVSLCFCRMQK